MLLKDVLAEQVGHEPDRACLTRLRGAFAPEQAVQVAVYV